MHTLTLMLLIHPSSHPCSAKGERTTQLIEKVYFSTENGEKRERERERDMGEMIKD